MLIRFLQKKKKKKIYILYQEVENWSWISEDQVIFELLIKHSSTMYFILFSLHYSITYWNVTSEFLVLFLMKILIYLIWISSTIEKMQKNLWK